MKLSRATVLAALVALGGGCSPGHSEQSVPADGAAGTLRAEIDFGDARRWDRGSFEVTAHDGAEVRIETERSGWGRWGARVDLVKNGTDVGLHGSVGGPLYWLFGGPTLRVRAYLPKGWRVDARTTGGRLRVHDFGGDIVARSLDDDIRISGVAGSAQVESRRGRVELKDVTGDARVSTSRSDVSLEGVGGAVEASSEWGSIELQGVAGGVRASTARGSVAMREVSGAIQASTELGDIELQEVTGPLSIRSTRGKVTAHFTGSPAGRVETELGGIGIRMPLDSKLALDARTRRGTLRLDGVFWLDGALDDRSASGTINGGGETLLLRSGTGSIDLDSR